MTQPRAPQCILVIDDEPANRRVLGAMLEHAGHQVESVASGEEALLSVFRDPPDLVLLDMMMPVMDGVEVARRIKGTPNLQSVPIIGITSSNDESFRRDALEAGVEDFLVRPVARTELTTRVRNLLRLKSFADNLAFKNAQLEHTADARGQKLAASEDLYRSVVALSPDVVAGVKRDGVVAFSNRPEHPSFAPQSNLFKATEGDSGLDLRRIINKALDDGSTHSASAVLSGEDAGSARSFVCRVTRHTDEPDTVLLYGTDVTESLTTEQTLKKTADERDQARQQFIQAQKMEAIGRLAGGVAHDFNNLLTSIIGFTRYVRDDLDENDDRRADLGEVLKAAESASRLTSHLLSFSRRRALEPKTIELGETVRAVAKMLRRTIGENIELIVLTPEEQVFVFIDRGQLDQLIFNLAVNARDAMSKGGTLTIEVTCAVARRRCREARLSVKDTGCGMSQEVMAQIFEPFFSTKGELGTGLGLSTCHGIARQAGGDIMVDSAVNQGTVFTVVLPAQEAQDARLHALPRAMRTVRGSGLALVVEDQPAILYTMERSLRDTGFKVIPARTAEEALALLDAGQGLPTLLVADVVLPGLSGVELWRRLRERNPSIASVLTSGYMSDTESGSIETDERTLFLPKPFAGPDLVDRVGLLFPDQVIPAV